MHWLLLATFVAYFFVVIGVGAYFYNKSAKMDEYFLADRQLNPYVVALSAQASDMSGWLLMGLPGAILLAGVGEVWVGIGLAIGTYFAWLLIAKRLRVYSEKADNSITISEYFSNRFSENRTLLRVISGVVILVFFTFYVASAFVAGGNVLHAIFPDQSIDLLIIIGAAIIIIYTFLGGFNAVCWTDFLQGMLMLVAIIIVPLALMGELGGVEDAWQAIQDIAAVDGGFSLNFMSVGILTIISGLAWGLGYFGMPHIMVRYMAIRDAKEIKVSRRVATVWVVIALACACLVGLVGRAWVESNGMITEPGFNPELILIYAVNNLWAVAVPVLAGVIFAALMAAIMSTADSQLLVASSAVSNDIYKHYKGEDVSDEKLVWISRGIVIVIAVIAVAIALGDNKTIMNLVSFAWAGFGAAFGPLVVLSLFWKGTNSKGAVAGIVVGFLSTILWNTFLGNGLLFSGMQFTDFPLYGLYELLPGFLLSALAIIIVSLATGGASEEIKRTFEEVDAECRATSAKIKPRTAGIAGIISALTFFLFLDLANRQAPSWSFTHLRGELNVAGGSAGVYAFIGTFVAGFIALVAFVLLMRADSDRKVRCMGLLGALAAFSFMLAGFVDMGFEAHDYFVYAALILAVVPAVAVAIRDAKEHPVFAGLTVMALIVGFAVYIGGAAAFTTSVSFALMFVLLVQSAKQFLKPCEC